MNTPEDYLSQLPDDRKAVMRKLRKTIQDHLPKGFIETIEHGMIAYVVPHSLYPKGYHVKPEQALPFISLASQKNFIALYHMGLYASPPDLKWFTEEYPKYCKTKLDMGKSCIRFKKMDDIPFDLIAALSAKFNPKEWIKLYEATFKH